MNSSARCVRCGAFRAVLSLCRQDALAWCVPDLHTTHMQMDKGLEAHGQSTLMSLPTMIDVLPTGCGLRVQHRPADQDIEIVSDSIEYQHWCVDAHLRQ